MGDYRTIMQLPPKMAAQFAERAKTMDGCVKIGDHIYQWAQGNTVITLMSIDHPFGHTQKDKEGAARIRAEVEARK